jgi:hypothetical protein
MVYFIIRLFIKVQDFIGEKSVTNRDVFMQATFLSVPNYCQLLGH